MISLLIMKVCVVFNRYIHSDLIIDKLIKHFNQSPTNQNPELQYIFDFGFKIS